MEKEKNSRVSAPMTAQPMQALVAGTNGELSGAQKYRIERIAVEGQTIQRLMVQGMSDPTQTVAFAFQAMDEFTTRVTVRERLNVIMEDY